MTDSSAEGNIDQLQAEIERLKRENEKLRASNRRWMRIAGTDAQTGLPNKVFFTTALLPQFINQANADSVSFACLILAPDGLGEINERHGREGGDQIVKEMATFLKENLEKGERLACLLRDHGQHREQCQHRRSDRRALERRRRRQPGGA